MNTYFKKITEYFNEENVSYEYDENKNSIVFEISIKDAKTKFRSFILEFDEVFQSNIGMYISEYESLSQDKINKISEYIHRANLGMIRGNFEYDIDKGIIGFKHYFEKSSVADKKYAMYNILLPIAMYLKYMPKILEIINTSKTPKELIEEVEEDNEKEKNE